MAIKEWQASFTNAVVSGLRVILPIVYKEAKYVSNILGEKLILTEVGNAHYFAIAKWIVYEILFEPEDMDDLRSQFNKSYSGTKTGDKDYIIGDRNISTRFGNLDILTLISSSPADKPPKNFVSPCTRGSDIKFPVKFAPGYVYDINLFKDSKLDKPGSALFNVLFDQYTEGFLYVGNPLDLHHKESERFCRRLESMIRKLMNRYKVI